MLAGVIIGIVTILNPGVTVERIGRNLIDNNVLNAIAPRASFGRFIATRLIEFGMITAFIFLLCQTRFTSIFVFGYITFRTSTITINLFWIIARLGMFGGVILFSFYLVFFLLLLCLLAAKTVFIMKQCAILRNYGFRRGICWWSFFKTICIFATLVSIIAVLEWLCFWLIFSKILWPIVFLI